MTGDYGTPDHHTDGDRQNSNLRKAQPQGISPLRPAPAHQSPVNHPPVNSSVPHSETPRAHPATAPAILNPPLPYDEAAGLPVDAPATKVLLKRRRRRLKGVRFPRSWQFWGIVLMIAFGGLGIFSATALLRLPSLPNCPAIFWPTASASLRIYCAQLSADRRTVKDLLRAISLVDGLPKDHPLRSEIDHDIETWSKEVLQLGEETFQAGDLNKAIEIARKIPTNTSAHGLVEDQVNKWKAIWQKAEGIYNQSEDALRKQDLRQAFRIATQLLGIGNQYWENTKYRELNSLIVETREDGSKLDKARGLADQGSLTNLLAAIKLVEEIKPTSHLYQKAQESITDFGNKMLDLAQAALDRRDSDEALKITRQIPEKAGLQAEIRDFSIITEAQSQAWGGTIDDLDAAIVNVQRIKRDRPLYGKAQQLVSNWQLEIQDVTMLNRAQQLAQPGTTRDLNAAIAEAQRVPFGNPRREEAEKEISHWTAQIETSEDQPYLDRAEQLASAGSWQDAIHEASQIRPGRALYNRANSSIDEWTTQIQKAQDQPQLDRARQLASAGNLEGAIAIARQIGSERALYGDAQAEIGDWSDRLERFQDQPYLDQAKQLARQGNVGEAIAAAERIRAGHTLYNDAQAEIQNWRSQFQGQDQLKQAYNAAQLGTPAMLSAAIEIANQVPANNSARSEADRMINQWSEQILQIAKSQAGFNPSDAISIAERIPANTSAYAEAQQNIRAWQQLQSR